MQEVDLDDEVLSKYYFEPIAFSPLVKRPAFKPCVNYDIVTKRTKSLDRTTRREEEASKAGKKHFQPPPSDSEAVQPSLATLCATNQSSSAPALFPSTTPDSLDDELLLASLIPEQELWQPSSSESTQSASSMSAQRGSTPNFYSSRSQPLLPLLITSPASPRPSQQTSWPSPNFISSLPVSIPSEGATGYLSPNPGNQDSPAFKTPSVESFEEFQFTPPDYSGIQEAPRCAAPDPLTMLFGDISGKKAKGNTNDVPNPKVLTSKLSMIGLKKPKKQLSSYKLDVGAGNDGVPISPGFQKVRESKLKPRSLTFTSNSVFRPFALSKSEAVRSSSVTAFHRPPHKEPRTPVTDRSFPLSNIKDGEQLSEDTSYDGSGTASMSTIPVDPVETSILNSKAAEAISTLKKEGASGVGKGSGKLTDKDGIFGVFSKLMKEDKKETHKEKAKVQKKKEKEREKEEKREREKKSRIKRRSQLYSFSFSEKDSSERDSTKLPAEASENPKVDQPNTSQKASNFASTSLPSIPSYGKHNDVSSRSSSGSLSKTNDKANDIKNTTDKPTIVSPITIPLIFQSSSTPSMPVAGTLPVKKNSNRISVMSKGMVLSSKGSKSEDSQGKGLLTQKALTPAPASRGVLTTVKMTPPITTTIIDDDSVPPSLPSIRALSPFSRANLASVTPGMTPTQNLSHTSPKELSPGLHESLKTKRSSVSVPISTAIALFSGGSNNNTTNAPKTSKVFSRKAARNSVNITSTYGNSFNQASNNLSPVSKLSASYSSFPYLGTNVVTTRTVSSPDSPPVNSRDAPHKSTKNLTKVQLTGIHHPSSSISQQHSPTSSSGSAATNTVPTLRHTAGNTIKNISNALLKSYKASTSGTVPSSAANVNSSIKASSSDYELCKIRRGESINLKEKDKEKDQSSSAPVLPAFSHTTVASPSLLLPISKELRELKGGSLRVQKPNNRPPLYNRLQEISRESSSSLSSQNTSTSSYSSSLSADENQDETSPARSPITPIPSPSSTGPKDLSSKNHPPVTKKVPN